jgi:hypothetical protein
MENAAGFSLGLAILASIFWIVTHVPVSVPVKGKSPVPLALAKRKSGLVKCSTAKPHVPLYMRNDKLRRRAQDLVISVQLGKKAIAAHMEAERLGVCSPDCTVRTVIAGVVRDRKRLKKLQYDQPF